ncbi:hypothetical protein [Caulobacter endophyticus]|uniref:hypothetical protein n=1 Tax=Caulobacter endophyticus TaxID=2172652 RepID=UPI0011B25582|nr:hypothetical protein [Caulobacter endophyticus]
MIQLHGARGERKVEQGRTLYDGYRRALSLQYGGISETLKNNPLYARSRDAIGGRSVVSPAKRENMFLMITNYFQGTGFPEHHRIWIMGGRKRNIPRYCPG